MSRVNELEDEKRKIITDNEALKDENKNLKSRIVNMSSRNDSLSWELHQAQKVNKVFAHEKERLFIENERLRSYLAEFEHEIDELEREFYELGFWGLIKKAFKGLVK